MSNATRLANALGQHFAEQKAIDYAWRRARESTEVRLPLSQIVAWARTKFPEIDEEYVRREIERRFERYRPRRRSTP
jgi:hypothetical protein